jgi:hypothetical protein
VVELLTLLLRIFEVPVQISARRPAILTEVFRGYPQFLQANAGIVSQIRSRPSPSTPFSIYRSHFTPSFDAVLCESLTKRR